MPLVMEPVTMVGVVMIAPSNGERMATLGA
jgi:hypothetical protein